MKKCDCRNLDIKIIANKTFWKTIKPFFSDKTVSTEIIILINKGEVVPTEKHTVYVLNTFFSVIVTSLKILEYYDPIANNISDPILKLIVIGITMKETCNKANKLSVSFSQVTNKDSLEETQGLDIKNQLDIKKATQESDICVRINNKHDMSFKIKRLDDDPNEWNVMSESYEKRVLKMNVLQDRRCIVRGHITGEIFYGKI